MDLLKLIIMMCVDGQTQCRLTSLIVHKACIFICDYWGRGALSSAVGTGSLEAGVVSRVSCLCDCLQLGSAPSARAVQSLNH